WRSVVAAGVSKASGEVSLDAQLLAVDGDFVNVDGQAVGVQAKPAFAAHAVDIGSAVVQGAHAELAQQGPESLQGDCETAIDDEGQSSGGNVADSAQVALDQDWRHHASLFA